MNSTIKTNKPNYWLVGITNKNPPKVTGHLVQLIKM